MCAPGLGSLASSFDASPGLVASNFILMIIILCSPLLVERYGGCSVVNGGENVKEPWASKFLLRALRCWAGTVRPLRRVVKGSFEAS